MFHDAHCVFRFYFSADGKAHRKLRITQDNNRYLEVNMQHIIGISSRRLRISALALLLPAMSWAADTASLAVGPQYDTTHVYVERGKMDAFVDRLQPAPIGFTSK